MRLIETCPDDHPLAVQIFGHDPAVMRDAAQMLAGRGIDAIDINMGCPVDRITTGGAGSAMMCRPDDTLSLVQTVVESVTLPVTVKMRLGWDDQTITAPRFAREFEQVGVAAVSIHGRTREQGFRGSVNREGIRQVVEAVERIPVVGNGDICTIADAARMFEETGCHAISIGRGALANPWIFRQLQQWMATGSYSPAGGFDDRLTLLTRQFSFLVEQMGEELAISQFRRMGHWYLKGMQVRASLRHQFQQAKSREEWNAALAAIQEAGPSRIWRSGELPEMRVPVPAGPVEKW
jgi:nifR3 family TIM-barrel protein